MACDVLSKYEFRFYAEAYFKGYANGVTGKKTYIRNPYQFRDLAETVFVSLSQAEIEHIYRNRSGSNCVELAVVEAVCAFYEENSDPDYYPELFESAINVWGEEMAVEVCKAAAVSGVDYKTFISIAFSAQHDCRDEESIFFALKTLLKKTSS